jgi:DeoR family ulaG and ulaABCDEF operon transcriptional repressor
MLEAERHRLVLKLVNERSIVSVADLVEILGASEATVRRDINALADRNQLKRVRGGAESLTPRHEAHLVGMPFEMSAGIAAAQKHEIARAAAEVIKDAVSIIISGGTTTFALAEFLKTRELDILTNSVPLMRALLPTRNRLVLPGGTIYREQNIILSPHDHDSIEYFWGEKLFLGCYGINRFGLMEADPLILQAQEKLLKRAEEVIVLADSRKLRQRSSMIVAGLERISTLITDQRATAEELDVFRNRGIRVIQANSPSADESANALTSIR